MSNTNPSRGCIAIVQPDADKGDGNLGVQPVPANYVVELPFGDDFDEALACSNTLAAAGREANVVAKDPGPSDGSETDTTTG